MQMRSEDQAFPTKHARRKMMSNSMKLSLFVIGVALVLAMMSGCNANDGTVVSTLVAGGCF